MYNIRLINRQSPGDVMMLTAAVKALKTAYPDFYNIDVQTGAMGIWGNNPDVTPLVNPVNLVMQYPLVHKRNKNQEQHNGLHFLCGFIEFLKDMLKKWKLPYEDIKLQDFHGGIHLTDQEKNTRIISGRYWLIVAGWKSDYTAKRWDPSRWQQVVDILRDEIPIVQVGGGSPDRRKISSKGVNHIHPVLSGVVDLVGRTTIREFIRLIAHADGVICPVTCAMHVAAAFNKPCIALGGGREHWTWEAYNNETRLRSMRHYQPEWEPPTDDNFIQHKYLHSIGKYPCCKGHGCWKARIGETEGSMCLRPVSGGSIDIAQCQADITPEMIVDGVRDYYKETIDSIPEDNAINVSTDLKSQAERYKAVSAYRRAMIPGVHLTPPNHQVPVTYHKLDNATQPPGSTKKFTIHVLLYGDYFKLHERCITSILRHTPKKKFRFYIACNEVCGATVEWIPEIMEKFGAEYTLMINPTNEMKYPIMRKMFEELSTEWAIWLDDDSYVTHINWLHYLERCIEANPKAVMFGKKYWIDLKNIGAEWVKEAQWYKGKPFLPNPKQTTKYKAEFMTGGFWALKKEVIEALDWPDPRLYHNGGDFTLGEALRQNNYQTVEFYNGVAINRDGRRGYSEQPFTTQRNKV